LHNDVELKKTYSFKMYTRVMVKKQSMDITELTSQDMHHVIGTRSKSENHHPTMISVGLFYLNCASKNLTNPKTNGTLTVV